MAQTVEKDGLFLVKCHICGEDTWMPKRYLGFLVLPYECVNCKRRQYILQTLKG